MGVYFAHTGVDVSCVLRRFGICSLERIVVLVVFVLRGSFIMGRHLGPQELDQMFAWQFSGHTPAEIHRKLIIARRREGESVPDLTTVRRGLRSDTFFRPPLPTPRVLDPFCWLRFVVLVFGDYAVVERGPLLVMMRAVARDDPAAGAAARRGWG